jgi:hypothetical protein
METVTFQIDRDAVPSERFRAVIDNFTCPETIDLVLTASTFSALVRRLDLREALDAV